MNTPEYQKASVLKDTEITYSNSSGAQALTRSTGSRYRKLRTVPHEDKWAVEIQFRPDGAWIKFFSVESGVTTYETREKAMDAALSVAERFSSANAEVSHGDSRCDD